MNSENRVQWVYASESNEQLQERYDQWAQEYDEGMESDFGYVIPRIAAETLQQFVPKESRVLDAGAGTGLVGVELHRLGYTNLDAMDMSQGMLDEARGKGVYGNLYQMVMGEPLDLETGSYDAAICVGVLTLGHAPVHSLDELAGVSSGRAASWPSPCVPTSTGRTAFARSSSSLSRMERGSSRTSPGSSWVCRKASPTCSSRSGRTASGRAESGGRRCRATLLASRSRGMSIQQSHRAVLVSTLRSAVMGRGSARREHERQRQAGHDDRHSCAIRQRSSLTAWPAAQGHRTGRTAGGRPVRVCPRRPC